MNRLCSAALGVVSLGLLALPMIGIAVAVLLRDGRPVLFRQVRVGRDMRPFHLYKFRTMPAGDGDRPTALGAWLRRHRLDELPQLFNIVAGHMTIVGPRPEIPQFADPADEVFRRTVRVLPGLFDNATLAWLDEETVLAGAEDPDAYYRDVILPEKLAMSLRDVERRSFANDCRTIGRALALLARRSTNGSFVATKERISG